MIEAGRVAAAAAVAGRATAAAAAAAVEVQMLLVDARVVMHELVALARRQQGHDEPA